jgi:TP901 family phage tail tape measure protein
MANNDMDLKLNIKADNADVKAKLNDTAAGVEDVGKKAEKTNSVFYTFVAAATLGMVGLAKSIAGAAVSLYSFAQTTLGLNVRLETSNIGLKLAGFLVQNLRKEFTLSLGFLKTFSDYLDKVNFPITPITKFIDLMSKFNVVVGIGKGETIFQDVEKGAVKLGETLKTLTLANLKQDIVSAGHSLVLFAVNSAIAIKSLSQSIAREALFSQASRTIDGSTEQVKGLKAELDKLAATDLAVPVDQLYAVAGVAGAMGKSVQDIAGFVRTVSEGVIALNIPAEELAQKLGTIQTQLDLTEEGLVSLSDQINTVADTMPGKVQEIDIFEVLSTGVATAAKNFGLMKGETIALSGALLAMGEAPEKARTSIVNLLSSLQNAKNQTPDFQAGLAAMGTSAEKLAVDIKDKPLPALMQLLETMHGMDNAARLDIATKLLGKGQDAIALAKLVDNVDLLKQAINSATNAEIYSGSVHNAYVQQMKTVDASMTLLSNSTDSFTESLTVWLLPVINLVINGFRLLVNAATAVNNALPEPVKAFLAVSATVLSLGGVFRLLGIAMKGIGLITPGMIAALERAGIALVTLNTDVIAATRSFIAFAQTQNKLQLLKNVLSIFLGGSIGIAVGALALLGVGIAKLLPVTVKWGDTTATVGEIIAAAWETVLEVFDPIIESFKRFYESFNEVFNSASLAEHTADTFITIGKGVLVFITNVASAFKFLSTEIGESIGATATEISAFATLIDDIFSGKGVGKSIKEFTQKTTDNIKNFSSSMGKNLNDNFGDRFDGSLEKLQKGVDSRLKSRDFQKKLDETDKRPGDKGVAGNVGQSDEEVAAAKKHSDDVEKINKDAKDREIQAVRDNEAEKIRLYTDTATAQKQIDEVKFNGSVFQYSNAEKIKQQVNDFTFQQKLLAEQQLAIITDQRLQQELAGIESKKQSNIDVLKNDVILSKLENQLKEANAQKDFELAAYTAEKISNRKKELGVEVYQLTQDELVQKRTALAEIETATATQVKNLIALEQEHRNKAVGFLNEIAQLEQSHSEKLKQLDEIGLTETEINENKKRELAANTAQIKRLLANGDYSAAAELGKKTQELAFEIAQKTKASEAEADKYSHELNKGRKERLLTEEKMVFSTLGSSSKARKDYNSVVDLTKTALENASQSELKQAGIAKIAADNRKTTLDEIRTKIAQIDEAVKNGVQLKVTANTKEVDDAKTRIQQPTSSVHTIHNQIVNDAPAHASGGLIRGKGTGTSDEIPAMLSNGEYVIKADVVAKHGAGAFDAINYGGVKPQNYYASGGLVGGDDALKQKADELKKAAYAQAVSVFDDPKNQIIWRMDTGQTSTGSADPNSQQKNFENKVGEYLRRNGLPMEWREMYLSGVKANQVLRTTKASFMEKAKAQLELDNQFSTPEAKATPTPEAPRITRAAPPALSAPSFPSLTPQNFSPPTLSAPTASASRQTGAVSTVKFQAPDGSSTTGHSSDPNFASFFDALNTVSGVTRTN